MSSNEWFVLIHSSQCIIQTNSGKLNDKLCMCLYFVIMMETIISYSWFEREEKMISNEFNTLWVRLVVYFRSHSLINLCSVKWELICMMIQLREVQHFPVGWKKQTVQGIWWFSDDFYVMWHDIIWCDVMYVRTQSLSVASVSSYLVGWHDVSPLPSLGGLINRLSHQHPHPDTHTQTHLNWWWESALLLPTRGIQVSRVKLSTLSIAIFFSFT